MSGQLPDGNRTVTQAISASDVIGQWHKESLDANYTGTGSSIGLTTPNGYFMDQFGSQGNRAPLLLADRQMNQIKGRIFSGDDPQDGKNFGKQLQKVIKKGGGEEELFESLRLVSWPHLWYSCRFPLTPVSIGHRRVPLHQPSRRAAEGPGESTGAPQCCTLHFWPSPGATSSSLPFHRIRLQLVSNTHNLGQGVGRGPAHRHSCRVQQGTTRWPDTLKL